MNVNPSIIVSQINIPEEVSIRQFVSMILVAHTKELLQLLFHPSPFLVRPLQEVQVPQYLFRVTDR